MVRRSVPRNTTLRMSNTATKRFGEVFQKRFDAGVFSADKTKIPFFPVCQWTAVPVLATLSGPFCTFLCSRSVDVEFHLRMLS